MKKIKSSIHSWNQHVFLGFSFCVFALIASIGWGIIYAEDPTNTLPAGTTSTPTTTGTTPTGTDTTPTTTDTTPTVSGTTTSGGTVVTTTTQTIPNAPTGLSLGAVLSYSSAYIPLRWVDNATNEDKFNIERKVSGTTTWSYLTQITTANATSYIDTVVTAGTSYDYRVQACLSGTGCSTYSTLERVMIPSQTTASTTCTSLALTINNKKDIYYPTDYISYTWTCSNSGSYGNVTVFLQKPDGTLTTLSSTSGLNQKTSELSVANLVSGNYILKACLGTTCSPNYPYSTQIFVVSTTSSGGINTNQTPTIPNAPTNLSIYGGVSLTSTFTYIPLKWVDNATNEDKFNIERKVSGTTTWNYLTQITTANATSYIDTAVTAGTSYDYRVQACLSGTGCSAYAVLEKVIIPKANTTVVTPTIPNAPTGLSLGAVLSSASVSIPLKWVDNATNEDKFNIERKVSGTTTWLSLTQVTTPNLNYYLDYNVTAGISYDYRVQACLSGTGCSAYAFLEKVIIPKANTTTPTITVPVAPTHLAKEIIYTSSIPSIKITWTDNSTNETRFVIKRKLSTDATYPSVYRNVYPNITYYLDTDSIKTGVSYDYALSACSSDTLCSTPIELKGVIVPVVNINTETPTVSLTVPIAPTHLVLSNGTILTEASRFIPIRWTDNSTNEDKFNIDRRMNGGTWMYLTQIMGSNITYYADYNVTPGTIYDYRVQACLSGTGCSAYAFLEKVLIPLPEVVAPVQAPITTTSIIKSNTDVTITPVDTKATTVDTKGTVAELPDTKTSTEEVTNTPILNNTAEVVPITQKEIAETINIISQSPSTTTETKENTTPTAVSTQKVVDLVYKDTNKDGISDYESKYIYNIDPVKTSPVSVYEGKTITAADKVLLGFDPSQKELVKVTKEQPITSNAPIVSTYKVNKVELIKDENKVVLKGQALPNSFITIYIYSTPIVVTIKTDSRGEWQYLLDKELENGEHTVYTATVNNTGNIVAQSSPYSFTKTAEAASLKDLPVTGASVVTDKPGFMDSKNIFIIAISIIMVAGIALILMGIFTKKNIPSDNI